MATHFSPGRFYVTCTQSNLWHISGLYNFFSPLKRPRAKRPWVTKEKFTNKMEESYCEKSPVTTYKDCNARTTYFPIVLVKLSYSISFVTRNVTISILDEFHEHYSIMST